MNQARLPPSAPSDMPPPCVKLVISAVIMRAAMDALPPKRRRAYLQSIMTSLADMEDLRKVVRLRGREHDEAVIASQREAVAWMRGMIAAFHVADTLKPRER